MLKRALQPLAEPRGHVPAPPRAMTVMQLELQKRVLMNAHQHEDDVALTALTLHSHALVLGRPFLSTTDYGGPKYTRGGRLPRICLKPFYHLIFIYLYVK